MAMAQRCATATLPIFRFSVTFRPFLRVTAAGAGRAFSGRWHHQQRLAARPTVFRARDHAPPGLMVATN